MTEKKLEEYVRQYLSDKGFNIELGGNLPGEHGCDIVAYHPKWRKRVFIEAKSENPKSKYLNQHRHNNFLVVIGQIISRMDKEGNRPNKARIYGIAVPKTWENIIKNKVKGMKFPWKWMRLKVFLVDVDGSVEELAYSKFL